MTSSLPCGVSQAQPYYEVEYTRPLRLGLILACSKLPAWQCWLLRQLRSLQVEIPIVLSHSVYSSARSMGFRPLYRTWRIVDRALTNRSVGCPDPLVRVDARVVLNEAKWIEAGRCGQEFGPEHLDELSACAPDIVLQLGCEYVHEEICRDQRLTLWLGRLAGAPEAEGDLVLLSSIAKQRPMEATVEECKASRWKVRSYSFTALSSYSLCRSEARVYWKLAALLLQEFRGVMLRRRSVNVKLSTKDSASHSATRIERRLNVGLILGIARRQAARAFSLAIGRHTWVIGIRQRRCEAAADYYAPDLSGFVELPCPGTIFRADPFLLEYQGRHFIFYEEFRYETRKGHIGYVEVFDDLELGEPSAALDRPYHLSYPLVFCDNKELFMIPESASSGNVELYRCSRFPDQWALDSVLLKGFPGIDNTLIQQDGRFWMFTCRRDLQSDTADELHIFWATSLHGPWQPHRLNPVFSDVRRARGAGHFISVDGQLFRPSQDGSKRYGGQINLNRVVSLSEDDYQEENIAVIDNRWSPWVKGAHTWNADSKFEVIDGPSWRKRWADSRRKAERQ